MSQAKLEAIRLIETLSDDCTLEDIQYHLFVRQQVESGLAASDRGDLVSQEEVEGKLAEWLESAGQGPRSPTSEPSSNTSVTSFPAEPPA